MEDVLYPLRVGSSSSRFPKRVVCHWWWWTRPTTRCAPRTRVRHYIKKTAGYDAARTARLKCLLDGGLRQRSAQLGSELLARLAKKGPKGLHVRDLGVRHKAWGAFRPCGWGMPRPHVGQGVPLCQAGVARRISWRPSPGGVPMQSHTGSRDRVPGLRGLNKCNGGLRAQSDPRPKFQYQLLARLPLSQLSTSWAGKSRTLRSGPLRSWRCSPCRGRAGLSVGHAGCYSFLHETF
ncbi:hypothetical protein ABIB14_003078 [Arthrobacter sp. UYEF3]